MPADLETIRAQLSHTLDSTDLGALGSLYRGKVRDVYRRDDRLFIITTDRVSAFDHVLGTIPWKGEILNAIAIHNFDATKDIVQNHLLSVPDPNVLLTRAAKPFVVEVVVRAYLTGSLWRDYDAGRAERYGVLLPSGMKKDERFLTPILTPTTKEAVGKHDEAISLEQIVERGIMAQDEVERVSHVALALFRRGTERALERGLILVDTKYEFGTDERGALILIDEIHTPDSSRYWIASSYEERFAAGQPQEMLDKENLRQWLIEKHGFSGHGTPPKLDDEIRIQLSSQYMELYERLLGRPFSAQPGPVAPRIEAGLRQAKLL
jgi:phosphoribosylaminoimidazole-succinocarboxamide synthase